MSYTSNNWQTGDIVTAQKLNNIEQGIKDNETIVVTAVSPYAPNDFDVTAINALTALNQHKTVIVRLVDDEFSSVVWDLCLVSESIVNNDGLKHYRFAATSNGGDYVAPYAVDLIDYGSGNVVWTIGRYVLPNFSNAALFERGYEGSIHQNTMVFSDDAGGYWSPQSIENILPFGDQLEQIVSAALAAAETQKTSLSVVFSDELYAPRLFAVLDSSYSGAVGLMIHGRGSVMSFVVGSYWFCARCIGVSKLSGSDNSYFATFAGKFQPQMDKINDTIAGISNYPYTIDIYAEQIPHQDGTHSYQATATITVEKIPSVIVPMS